MRKRSVFVIGAGGMVGSAAAHSIAIREIAQEVVLIDVAEDMARGQALDINHAAAFTDGVHVRAGNYDEIKEDDIIVITCGLSQKPGQTRLDLLEVNAGIIKDVVAKVMKQGKPVFILMVSNPVDILTQVAIEASGLPKERVFGSGTTLDSARLRVTLANQLHVSQQQVQAFILGEHGNSSFPALDSATIAGTPLEKFPGFEPEMVANIEQEIRQAAYDIIAAKRSTYYGIGNTIARIVEAMMRDVPSVLSVSALAEGEYGLHDIAIGLPSLVSSRGVQILDDYPLTANEQQKLEASAEVLRAARNSLASVTVDNS